MAETFPIIQTKLYRPPLQADFIPRPQLLEQLDGCHGGMGSYQTQPFVLHPAELPAPDEPLSGAAAVHHLMKGWVSATNQSPE